MTSTFSAIVSLIYSGNCSEKKGKEKVFMKIAYMKVLTTKKITIIIQVIIKTIIITLIGTTTATIMIRVIIIEITI